MSTIGKEIIENFSRMLFCSAWADFEENEFQTNFCRVEIWDAAPETPEFAKAAGLQYCTAIQKANSLGGSVEDAMEKLYQMAVEANEKKNRKSEEPHRFGSDLALMSLGHGVSWFDDNARFPLRIPYITFDLYLGDDNMVYASCFEDYGAYKREPTKE